MGAVCEALTKTRQPCTAFAVSDSRFCFAHAPERRAERDAARRAGGRARQPLSLIPKPDHVRLRTVEDIQALLESIAMDALNMSNGLARNRLLVSVATVGLSAIERADDLQAIRESVERLRAEHHAPRLAR
jgi:hypothetical protein